MDTDLAKPGELKVTAQLRGETIAYAVQSGIYNIAANFFEPYIGYQTQKYYSGHNSKHPPHGNYGQNLAGEFAGDVIGASTLIMGEALASSQLHACTRGIRSVIDPLYTKIAHVALASKCNDPDYEQKIEQWKTAQERNFARSFIMGTSGIAGNILTQKMVIGNPSPTSVIFKGKLLSTAITTALGLGARMAFPEALKNVDRSLAKNFFTPMLTGEHGHAETMAHERATAPQDQQR